MTKPIKPEKITSVSRNFISVSRTFFHTGRMCFGESPLFSSFVYHLLSRQYPSFCTAVPIGQKILYTEEGICIHVPFQRVYTVFWTEIECLMRVDLRDLSNSDSGKTSLARTQNTEPSHYILISKSRKRICEIKEDDKNFEKVQMLLETYAIPTLDIAALLTDGDDVFRYLPALPFLTKCSCLFELHAQTTLEQFRGSGLSGYD